MNVYRDILVSTQQSLTAYGSIYTLCKEQPCNTVVDSYLQDFLTYDACSQIKKALRNVVIKPMTKSTMYIFTESCFSRFEILASEDDSTVDIDGKSVRSMSILSNLLYTTDDKFLSEDIPKLKQGDPSKYNSREMYIVRLLHRINDGESILSEDIVIYVPTRYLQ